MRKIPLKMWNLDINSLKINVSSFDLTLHDEIYLLKSKRKCSFSVSLKKNVRDFCRVRIEQILCKLWMNVEQIVSRFTMETIPDFERSSSCDDAKNQSGNLFLIRAPIYHHFSPRFSSLKKKTENERKCYAWIFTPKIAKKSFCFRG